MNAREDQHWGCWGNTSSVTSWQFDGHAPYIFSECRNSTFLLYFFEPPNFENMCFVGGFYYRRSQHICEFLWVSRFMKQLEKKSPFYPTCRQSDPQKRWCYWSISPSWWLVIDPTPNAMLDPDRSCPHQAPLDTVFCGGSSPVGSRACLSMSIMDTHG